MKHLVFEGEFKDGKKNGMERLMNLIKFLKKGNSQIMNYTKEKHMIIKVM